MPIHLEDGETRLEIPRRFLPAAAREGSWLDIAFTLDPEEAKRQEKRILKALYKQIHRCGNRDYCSQDLSMPHMPYRF